MRIIVDIEGIFLDMLIVLILVVHSLNIKCSKHRIFTCKLIMEGYPATKNSLTPLIFGICIIYNNIAITGSAKGFAHT